MRVVGAFHSFREVCVFFENVRVFFLDELFRRNDSVELLEQRVVQNVLHVFKLHLQVGVHGQ